MPGQKDEFLADLPLGESKEEETVDQSELESQLADLQDQADEVEEEVAAVETEAASEAPPEETPPAPATELADVEAAEVEEAPHTDVVPDAEDKTLLDAANEVLDTANEIAEQVQEPVPAAADENTPLFKRWDQFMTEIDPAIRNSMWEMGINSIQALTGKSKDDLAKPKGQLNGVQVKQVMDWLAKYDAELAPVVKLRPAARRAAGVSTQDKLSPQERHQREMERRGKKHRR